MPIRTESNPSRPSRSLVTTLATAFVILSAIPLLLISGLLGYFEFQAQREALLNNQQLTATEAAKEVSGFIENIFSALEASVRVGQVSDRDQQRLILEKLLGLEDALREIVLVDAQGQKIAEVSRRSLIASSGLLDLVKGDLFTQVQQGHHFISEIYFDEATAEPLVALAVPMTDVFGEFQGALIAEVNLKFMWDVVDQLQVGASDTAYVVDKQGRLIALRLDAARVLRGENLSQLPEVAEFIETPGTDEFELYSIGINDSPVVAAFVPLGTPDWAVIVEKPVEEAYYDTLVNLAISLVILIVVAIVAGFAGVYAARILANPLLKLTQSATRIAAGELNLAAPVEGPTETVYLADAFNSMTDQLRELITSLERRVAERTQRLRIAATLSERLNAILEIDQLLREMVDQVKESLDYYHAQVYLIDDTRQNLVIRAGSGEAGTVMQTQGHTIPLNASTNLITQAVTTGEIVIIDDLRQTEGWLPNPLLPETYAEMAIPIVVEGQVVGVLDVQEDEAGGLDEGDADLLRSLANQVSVALTNARLFEETLRAKEAADESREEVEAANKILEEQIWHTMGQAQLNDKMRGQQDISTLANNVLQQLCEYLQAQIGSLYLAEDQKLHLVGRYAYSNQHEVAHFNFGEGLVGQTAIEKRPIFMTDVPADYIRVRSGLGEAPPRNIMIYPFRYENQLMGVIELGTLHEFNSAQMEFIETALINIAITFNTAQARAQIQDLLTETQRQAEVLQSQSEELRVSNEELEAQTESLRVSEARLRENQLELETTNTQLEEKQTALDKQNQALKITQQELEKRAEELALTNRYRSEFLSNMSHELRTPLNSLLILAHILAGNREGNLTKEQIEFAEIIYKAGTDLLALINDILDLTKVETGSLPLSFESVSLTNLLTSMRSQFNHAAEEKRLKFTATLAADLPEAITTDGQRLRQILKNLLSNAFKFTAAGSVSFKIARPDPRVDLSQMGLASSEVVAFSVTDTGIGLTMDQQQVIFEAFKQADGSATRQFGGAGLGLTISKELAARLGGQIGLVSEPGRGSTFTLYLPIENKSDEEVKTEIQPSLTIDPVLPEPPPLVISPVQVPDDRAALQADDKIVLVIEDDAIFAKIVHDFAKKKSFKGLIALDGQTGLALVKQYLPDAIILDLHLPDISGWEVMDTLKQDPTTRHIPVHIISAEEETLDAYRRGAIGYLTKPVSGEELSDSFEQIEQFIAQSIKNVLLVEDDAVARQSIKALLAGNDIRISEADRGETALAMLKTQHFDCLILDLSLPDMSGFEVLRQLNDHDSLGRCPVIVYTGRDLTPEENEALMKYADSVIVKGVRSPERLLDETALFLHRVVAQMPADKQQTIKHLYKDDDLFEGKKILVVDDDMRNSFALSKLLTDKGIEVRIASNGQKALDMLAEEPVDLVLMDIMMPVMDGYEATKQIRLQSEWRSLPILALTAKAMKGDQEKCLAAGANDYLPKPIDVDRLFSMLRVWLYR